MSIPRIHCHFWAKPIPTRSCDWIATYDDYEGGDGYDEQPGPTGEGATEAEAVLDLIENHPRGIQCERDRRCENCIYFFTHWSRAHDGADDSQDRCARHNRATDASSCCDDHGFEGEHSMPRTLPAMRKPQEEEIVF